MTIRQFCDRCKVDVTGRRSSAVSIVRDADQHGSGQVTTTADLCARCRGELERWLAKPPERK